jgi:uroporphyrinogen-III synthase
MKLSDVKEKIDQYFEDVNPHDIIQRLASLGVTFEDIDEYSDDEYVKCLKQNIVTDIQPENFQIISISSIESVYKQTFIDDNNFIIAA